MNYVEIEIEGKMEKIFYQKMKSKLWIHFLGQTHSIETQKSKTTAGGKNEERLEILAPMPGKITKVLKNENDTVNPGDTLVVMEAMKMEYALKSDLKGLIQQVLCRLGDQVSLGQKLVQLAKDSSNQDAP